MNGPYTEIINQMLDYLISLTMINDIPKSDKPTAMPINDNIVVRWENKIGEIYIFIDPETFKIRPNLVSVSKGSVTEGFVLGIKNIEKSEEACELLKSMQIQLKMMLAKYTKNTYNPNQPKR